MSRPSGRLWCDNPNNVWRSVHSLKLIYGLRRIWVYVRFNSVCPITFPCHSNRFILYQDLATPCGARNGANWPVAVISFM
jgi:hypothetical protein